MRTVISRNSMALPKLALLGKRLIELTSRRTGTRHHQQPTGLTSGYGCEDGIRDGLRLINNHQKILCRPLPVPTLELARIVRAKPNRPRPIRIVQLVTRDPPTLTQAPDILSQRRPELPFDLTPDTSSRHYQTVREPDHVPQDRARRNHTRLATAVGSL